MKKIAFTKRVAVNGLGTWTSTGIWFGFPKCCIAAFEHLEHMSKDTENWPLIGTGFVPCEKCATTKTEEQLIQEISANRFCPAPFPEGGSFRGGVDKETKWVIKQLTGRIDPVLDEVTLKRLRGQVESKQEEHRDNKEIRKEVQTKLSGLTARQILTMKKHRRFFADFFRGTFQISFQNQYWKDIKADFDYVTYRVGKTRFVLSGGLEVFEIIDQVEALGGVCKHPENLKRVKVENGPHGYFGYEQPPKVDPRLIGAINGEELSKLHKAFDDYFATMAGRFAQITTTPYIFHKPDEMILGRGIELADFPKCLPEPRLPVIREEMLAKIREEVEKARKETNYDLAAAMYPRHFVFDSLGGLDLDPVEAPKIPVQVLNQPRPVFEISHDVFGIPASVRHMLGVDSKKED